MNDHPYDVFEAFALGDLDPATQAAVLDHADACAVCAPMLAEAMAGVAAIARADGERGDGTMGAALKRDLYRSELDARQVSERQLGARQLLARSGWWAAALSTAAAILFAGVDVNLRSSVPTVPVDALVHSHFTHHPLTGAGGNAKMMQALDGAWVYFVADGLRPGAEFELRVNGAVLGDAKSTADGSLTAYFTRPKAKIVSAALAGPGGTALHWP